MSEQIKKNGRADVSSRMVVWGAGLLCAVVVLWQCVAPPNIDATYKLCRTSADCSQKETVTDCVLNACVPRSIRPLERSNKEIPGPDAEKIIPEPDGSTKEPDPPERTCPANLPNCQFCTRKEDCGPGNICKFGEDVCRPGCVNELDCGDKSKPVCDINAQICKECVTTRHCKLDAPGTLCINDKCSACSSDPPCKTEYGVDSVCVSGKCSAVQCSTGADCVGKCTGEGDCLCLSNACGFCGNNGDCGVGKRCVDKKCLSECTADAQCTALQRICWGGLCRKNVILQGNARQWSDGTFASDCAEYRFPRKVDYAAATANGLYNIKPSGVAAAFPVYCEMTYAGGGWTLVLKADGAGRTFDYKNVLWTNQSTHPASNPDPDLNRTEAKLQSYWTVPVGEILLQMQETTADKIRSGIAHMSGTSIQEVMNKPDNTNFSQGMGQTLWRSLVKDSVLAPECFEEGVNRKPGAGSDIIGARLGFLASSSAGCKASSVVGFGLEGASIPVVGNAFGAKKTGAFGYVLVRKLLSWSPVFDDAGAKAPVAGGALESCLAYRLPPYAVTEDGVYWLKPVGQSVRKKAYCLMSRFGGGWTLAAKVDGGKKTFLYGEGIWENKTPFGEDKLDLNNAEEAKFESFGTLAFSQIVLGFRSPPAGSPERFVVVHKQANSLQSLFVGGAYSTFDYGLGKETWKSVIASATLIESAGGCIKEGFNVFGSISKVRIGVGAGDESVQHCTNNTFVARLGVGTKAEDCSYKKDASAGSFVIGGCSGNADNEISSFVNILVR